MTTPARTEAGARAYALLDQAFADPTQALALARQMGEMYQAETDSRARAEIGDAQAICVKLIPDTSLAGRLADET